MPLPDVLARLEAMVVAATASSAEAEAAEAGRRGCALSARRRRARCASRAATPSSATAACPWSSRSTTSARPAPGLSARSRWWSAAGTCAGRPPSCCPSKGRPSQGGAGAVRHAWEWVGSGRLAWVGRCDHGLGICIQTGLLYHTCNGDPRV